MNTRLLRRIQKRILKEPENFYMPTWHCGTAHCIGGWAAVLSAPKNEPFDFSSYEFENAIKFLKLNSVKNDTDLLFCSRWPNKYSMPYNLALRYENRAKAAQIAAELIDYFIECKGNMRT